MAEFRAMVWQWAPADEGRHAGTLHSVHEVEADDIGAAAALVLRKLAEQGEGEEPQGVRSHAMDAVPVALGERLLVDVQDKAMPVEHKLADDFAAGAHGEWFIVSGSLPDLAPAQIERAEALMSRRFPDVRFSSEQGSIVFAVATVAVLADEASQDVEDALEKIGDALRVGELMSGSGSCGRVGNDQPSGAELDAALREAHEDHRRFERWEADGAAGDGPDGSDGDLGPVQASRGSFDAEPPVEPDAPHDRELICEVLLKVAAKELPEIDALAADLATSSTAVTEALSSIERWGLALFGDGEQPPLLLHAGEQFLTRRGDVSSDTLEFLSSPIDDLNAREALRRAGSPLVDEFGAAIADGHGIEHACELVPPAFSAAVDATLATRLHAAMSALMVRLANGDPAGCVAEEMLAVSLLREAEALLRDREQELGEDEVDHAVGELRGIFELFQDDDVLQMFKMVEPADAAVAGEDPVNVAMGVADQRVEAWFDAFGGTVTSGHLTGSNYRWP
jgi:hypothetical protein